MSRVLTVSQCHCSPGQVLGKEEIECGFSIDLGWHVAGYGGYPVVSVDDPAVREMSGEVLVLAGLHQTELCDGPVLDWPHQPHKPLAPPDQGLDVTNNVHVLVLDQVLPLPRFFSEPDIERSPEGEG